MHSKDEEEGGAPGKIGYISRVYFKQLYSSRDNSDGNNGEGPPGIVVGTMPVVSGRANKRRKGKFEEGNRFGRNGNGKIEGLVIKWRKLIRVHEQGWYVGIYQIDAEDSSLDSRKGKEKTMPGFVLCILYTPSYTYPRYCVVLCLSVFLLLHSLIVWHVERS